MTFEDFLESTYAKLRKPVSPPPPIPDELAPLGDYRQFLDLVESAHVFRIDEEIDDHLTELRTIADDVLDDLKSTFPLPFKNLSLIQPVRDPESSDLAWHLRWILRLDDDSRSLCDLPKEATDHFLFWQYSPAIPGPPDFRMAVCFAYVAGRDAAIEISQTSLRRLAHLTRNTEAWAGDMFGHLIPPVVLQIAALSHPAHYIVERTPRLTPREERRVAAGDPRPDRKRKHFIVIDHDELVALNPATRSAHGAHASPVPHARRAHWRKLADRCAKARAEGKTKVWVGETYVGDREFGDEKNRYRVILPRA